MAEDWREPARSSGAVWKKAIALAPGGRLFKIVVAPPEIGAVVYDVSHRTGDFRGRLAEGQTKMSAIL